MEKMPARRGFSIAEAVVAMMLISIVSVSAFTAVTASMRVNKRVVMRFSSLNLINDCLECFKFSEDSAAFNKALAFYGKDSENGDYTEVQIFLDDVYVFWDKTYNAVVTINWEKKTFVATAIDKDGALFYEFGKQDDGSVLPFVKGG